MQLKIPTNLVFYITVALAVLSLILSFVGGMGTLAFWGVVIAFVVLALGVTVPGL
jgi:hypothetical protein